MLFAAGSPRFQIAAGTYYFLFLSILYALPLLCTSSMHLLCLDSENLMAVITTNNGRQPWAIQGSLSEALIRCPSVPHSHGEVAGAGR